MSMTVLAAIFVMIVAEPAQLDADLRQVRETLYILGHAYLFSRVKDW